MGPLAPPELPEIDLLFPLPAGALLVAIAAGEGGPALSKGLAQRAWLSAWSGTFPGVTPGLTRLAVVAESFAPATRWAAAAQSPGLVQLYRYRPSEAPGALVLEGVPVPAVAPDEPLLVPALLSREEILAFASYQPRFLDPDRHADA
jgi:hypothetical protein